MATNAPTKPPGPSRIRAKPTPEEIAKLREERERKKQAREQAERDRLAGYAHPLLAAADDPRAKLVEREWVRLSETADGSDVHRRVTVKTWNLLAQALVRRKLFPTSDCLKSSEREYMLYRELTHPKADIMCLQEVDRLEKIQPYLESAGYDMVYASGPRKKHGCMIAFRKDRFQQAGERVVHMDDAEKGASFKTKNIGSLVALRDLSSEGRGVVVSTTHLFWHPSYTYERTRQAAILLRETIKFRTELSQKSWPCILAGDFNFAPDDAAYALLVGMPLLPKHNGMLARSRVVHASIDPSVPITTRKMIGTTEQDEKRATASVKDKQDGTKENSSANAIDDEDEEEGGTDPDRAITNAREARPEDGLFTTAQLQQMYEQAGAPVRSIYDEAQRASDSSITCGSRLELPDERLGSYEPEWTSYTHYWKTVLDYLFVLDAPEWDVKTRVTGYLKPPTTEQLQPGIPMMGVTSSDHVSLTVELLWGKTST